MSEYETSSFTTDTSSIPTINESESELTFSISDKKTDVEINEDSNNKPQTQKAKENGNDNEISTDKWEDILGSGSLMKKIITEGTPDSRPQRLENCVINYECTLENGTVVEKKEKFKVQLGDCEVIQGLDLALGLMNVNEVCKLKIEGRLAYGQKGLEPVVPPDTTVYVDVQLLAVEPEDEPENFSIADRRSKGNDKRERGNWWYSRGENQLAIQCYRRALDYLDEVEGGIQYTPEENSDVSDAALQQILEDRINVSNNMAAAQLKLELYDAALQSLQTVLHCQPDNVKALFRKARVYKAKNDVQAALSCLKKAEKLSPQDADIIREITGLEKIKEKQRVSEKELARRMFNGLQSGNKPSKKRSSAPKLMTWFTLGATIAVGLAGLAVYRFKFS